MMDIRTVGAATDREWLRAALVRWAETAGRMAQGPGGDDGPMCPRHLVWMCDQATMELGTWPIDKAARWLGFVQGICVVADGGPANPHVDAPPRREPEEPGPPERACRTMLERCRILSLADPRGAGAGKLCSEALAGPPMGDAAAGHLLGFIQGLLCACGLADVDGERNFSRPLFHAAYLEAGYAVPSTRDRIQ